LAAQRSEDDFGFLGELVEDIVSVGDRGEQPIKVVPIDVLQEDNSTEKRSGVTRVRAEFSEHEGGE